MMKVVGKTPVCKFLGMYLPPSTYTVKSQPSCALNFWIVFRLSVVLTRIKSTLPLYFSLKANIEGNSLLQGPHQVAQMFKNIGLSNSLSHTSSPLSLINNQ